MSNSTFEQDRNTKAGLSRRTLVRGAAWTLPVVAAVVATPLAAASPDLAALTYSVTPLVDVYAPYGANSVAVTNNSTVDYVGPITFTTPSWSTVAPFALTGAIRTTDGTNTVWTLPAATVAAGKSLVLNLTWGGPNPPAAETQPLTVTVDPILGTATPAGTTTIDSPYALLWYAVTPGGQGSTTGSLSLFIGNTTETPLSGNGVLRTGVWSFPLASARPITTNGTQINGVRIADSGTFVSRYDPVPLSIDARTGKQVFAYVSSALGGTGSIPQYTRPFMSASSTDSGATLVPLGDELIYSPYRP